MIFSFSKKINPSIFRILILLSLNLSVTELYSNNSFKENIVTKIEKESEGNISIDIPPSILDLIITPYATKSTSVEIKPGINKLSGYRIQVFSDGRNQSTLEARAKARGSSILAKFPKYRGQVYTYSSSPNWYTRIGNFRTQAEANSALNELKQAFPNIASEMRVVKCQIVVIKQ